jgi:hypothetical protein
MHGKASFKHPTTEFEAQFEDGEFHGHVFIKYIKEDPIYSYEGQY